MEAKGFVVPPGGGAGTEHVESATATTRARVGGSSVPLAGYWIATLPDGGWTAGVRMDGGGADNARQDTPSGGRARRVIAP